MSLEVDNSTSFFEDDMNFTTISTDLASEMLMTTAYNQTNYSNVTISEERDIAYYSVLCIKGFIFGSIIIGAVLGNALVILAVRRNRKLRYVYCYTYTRFTFIFEQNIKEDAIKIHISHNFLLYFCTSSSVSFRPFP